MTLSARRLCALGLSGLLAAFGLVLFFRVVQAEPAGNTIRFAASNGSGGACLQSSPCSLPTAIVGSLNGDIVYVRQGTYTSTNDAVISVSHSITLYGGWSGNPAGQPSVDPRANPTVIDGQGVRRGVYIGGGSAPTLQGFIIRNGNATGLVGSCEAGYAAGCGGGMYVDHAAPRILHNQFISNTALITSNIYVDGFGGGLFVEWGDGAIISGNTFMSNSAALPYPDAGGHGGGLSATGYNLDGLLVENNLFIGNSAKWGGGLDLNEFTYGQVQGNQFQNNRASIEGAGLNVWNGTAGLSSNTLHGNQGEEPALLGYFAGTFNGNLVVDNPAEMGLWVVNNDGTGTPLIFNNILAHNGDQGIRASGSISFPLTLYFVNNTVVGGGSGTGLVLADGGLTATAVNNLFSSFSTGVIVSFPVTTNATLSYTLLDTNITTPGNAVFGHTVVGAPDFVDPANRNYHIGYNSAARDTGQTTIFSTDYDGDPRPLGAHTDIGADETRFLHGVFLALIRR